MTYKFIIFFTLMLMLLIPANAYDVTELYDIPYEHDVFFSHDWYDTNDTPNITATVEIDNTFDENEERILNIAITNTGYMHALEGTSTYPDTPQEVNAANTEANLEYQSTTAKSVTSVLMKKTSDEPFTIKTDTGVIGSLGSGQSGKLQYDIKIDDDAPPGKYPLILKISYDYQRDVAVYPVNKYDQMTAYKTYYDMASANTTQEIYIIIEPYADFEIIHSNNSIKAGSSSVISSVVKNIGTETAKNSVAHLSLVDPFDADVTDYYIGTLKPGESKEIKFKVKALENAIPGKYRIDTEIKYEDKDGKTKYSDTLKTKVKVTPGVSLMEQVEKYRPIAAILVVLLILVLIGKMLWKKSESS